MANDIRSMIVGAAIGAGVVAHVLVGWPREPIATRESEGLPTTAREVRQRQRAGIPASKSNPNPAWGTQSTGPDLDDLYAAIAHVETGGERDRDHAIGDGGASLGRYQIQLAYWRDAWGLDRAAVTDAMREQYRADVTDPATARETMRRYWRRWCPEALDAGDWRTLARVHNGGPRGATKAATEAYAADVLAAMD